jgi:hypothetical protein
MAAKAQQGVMPMTRRMLITGIRYLVKSQRNHKVRKNQMTDKNNEGYDDINSYDHPGVAMFMKFQSDWHTLSEYQQQLATENNSIIYKRYRLSQKYGKHVYNYLTNGGIRKYNDKYVVMWDSSDSNQ